MAGGMADERSVGPDLSGSLETYQLIRRLQVALFGAVYEARGKSTGKDLAIKVLHKSELRKMAAAPSFNFCETPLSELTFAYAMRGHENVQPVLDTFEDQYCHYIVFELARGGDLLEGLKDKPRGYSEQEAQYLMRQAVQGMVHLHGKSVALQDVSLENLLLCIEEDGRYTVKICDPGQAAQITVDHGRELPTRFRGLIGKSFRPPELYELKPYMATKVDSWCLGWSCFYLLTAQALFGTADLAERDADWELFRKGEVGQLLAQKQVQLSELALDFVLSLVRVDPAKRMSLTQALQHPWLTQPVPVMMADGQLVQQERKSLERQRRARSPAARSPAARPGEPGVVGPLVRAPQEARGRGSAERAASGSSRRLFWPDARRAQPARPRVPSRGLARSPSPLRDAYGRPLPQVPAAAVPQPLPVQIRWDGAQQHPAQRHPQAHKGRSPSPRPDRDLQQHGAATRYLSPGPSVHSPVATGVRVHGRAASPAPASHGVGAALRAASPLGHSAGQPRREAGMIQPQTRGRPITRSPSPGPLSPRQQSPFAWKDVPMSPAARFRAVSPGLRMPLSPGPVFGLAPRGGHHLAGGAQLKWPGV